MPNRIIREGMIESEAVNSLSPEAECCFVRLMLKADDYGRFTGNTLLLKAALYPLKPDVRISDIARWIAECEQSGLVRGYQVSGKPYLAISRFGQRQRAEKSKFPEPPFSVERQTDDGQAPDDCLTDDGQPPDKGKTAAPVVGGVVVDEVVGKRARKRAASPLPEGFAISDRVKAWASERGYTKLAERFEQFVGYVKRNDKRYADWDEAFMGAVREDWAKLGGAVAPSKPAAPHRAVQTQCACVIPGTGRCRNSAIDGGFCKECENRASSLAAGLLKRIEA